MSSSPKAAATEVGVVGAGSWGTTLALLLHEKGHRVRVWSHDEGVVEEVRRHGENRSYLPGVPVPEELPVSSDLPSVVGPAEVVLSVSPSQFVAQVMEGARGHFREDVQVVSASKGIEVRTLRRMDQVFEEFLTNEQQERFTVLSGPSFAGEVARKHPTAVAVASRSPEAQAAAQRLFQTEEFRVYTNDDVLGVELGGALKNVIALAAGVASGLGFGHNTLAALITRGLAEITRLGVVMGARAETFAGLAGMGDLLLTCTGAESRNRTVGYRLGRGESLEAILGDMKAVAEGVRTAPAVRELAVRHGVEMPISFEVYAILEKGRDPREAVKNLMLREPKAEH